MTERSRRKDPKGVQWDPEIKKEIIKLIDRCTTEWVKFEAKLKKFDVRLKALEAERK